MNRYELDDMQAEAIINRYKDDVTSTNKAVFIIGVREDGTDYWLDSDNCITDSEGNYLYALSVKASISAIKKMTSTKAIIVVLARRIGNYFVVLKTRTIRG